MLWNLAMHNPFPTWPGHNISLAFLAISRFSFLIKYLTSAMACHIPVKFQLAQELADFAEPLQGLVPQEPAANVFNAPPRLVLLLGRRDPMGEADEAFVRRHDL